MLLFKLFDREYSFIDVIDIVLVALLLWELYRLVRGTLGMNIFFGMLIIYLIYLGVKFLKLNLLTEILSQFVNAGVIALLIVFQPEIRRFLLQLGKAGLGDRENLWNLIRGIKGSKQGSRRLTSWKLQMLSTISPGQRQVRCLYSSLHLSFTIFPTRG